jgi:hypothetical protein
MDNPSNQKAYADDDSGGRPDRPAHQGPDDVADHADHDPSDEQTPDERPVAPTHADIMRLPRVPAPGVGGYMARSVKAASSSSPSP